VNQIARLFGVSNRKIYAWVNSQPGSPILNAEHEERLKHLLAVINSLAGPPEQCRRSLLKSSNGMSVFSQLVSELPDDAIIQPRAFTVISMLGI
jgi:hypothetical protein